MIRRAFVIFIIASLTACSGEEHAPLPMGYFRIDIPESQYIYKDLDCPFAFEISDQSRLEFFDGGKSGEICWFDLYYPRFKARVHFTYKELDDNLREYMEEARNMAFEHHVKAGKIEPKVLTDKEKRVFGMAYDIDGGVASHYQFYLTDSTRHFVRASLYFEAKPNQDSIRPVLKHVKGDLRHVIDSFVWK